MARLAGQRAGSAAAAPFAQGMVVSNATNRMVKLAPARCITFVIVLMGGLPSMAADSGHAGLIPLGARHVMGLA